MRRASLAGIVLLALAGGSLDDAPAATTPLRTGATGNLLVLLAQGRASSAGASAALATVATRLGASAAGFSVPQIGLITLRPPAGVSLGSFAAALRGVPGVASVQAERRYVPRAVPNDPALSTADASSGVVEWELQREGFYNAWSISKGDGAVVGVIDTGIDGTHPDLASKIAGAVDQQSPSGARGTARTDEVGHGTHVSSLACADTNNGIGMAGAGYNCKLLIEKTDFSDSSIAAAIVDAANRHVGALNMSFGPSSSSPPPAPESEVRALNYAAARKVVLVAAAADSPGTEQGDPANVLQPAGTGSDASRGIGLSVTAAGYSGSRADFAGYGSEISLAAFGALNPGQGGPPLCTTPPGGLLGAFPSGLTDLDNPINGGPVCRTSISGGSYAYLEGTSMAAPQVAAAGAMMRVLNPFATLTDVLRTLKLTATRARGTGFGNDLGWGILNAGAALDAIRRVDRLAPVSKLSAPSVVHRRTFKLQWTGHDQQWPELIASGIARFDVYVKIDRKRSRLLARTSRHSLVFHGLPDRHYVFYVVAIDHAGNRQQKPQPRTTRVAANAR